MRRVGLDEDGTHQLELEQSLAGTTGIRRRYSTLSK